MLTVIINCSVLKPVIGLELKCQVTVIFRHGIFCKYHELQVLVPFTKLVGYEYINSTFKNKRSGNY